MKKISRIIGSIFLLLLLFLALTWFVFENKKEWIIEEIEIAINRSQPGELKIESIEFVPFKSFPRMGTRLRNVVYYVDKDTVSNEPRTRLANIKEVVIDFDIWQLIRHSHIKINAFVINGLTIDITIFEDGSTSLTEAFSFPKKETTTSIQPFDLSLKKVKITNTEITIQSDFNDQYFRYNLTELLASINYSKSSFSFTLSTVQHIELITKKGLKIPKLGDFSVNTTFIYNTDLAYLEIDKGSVKFDFLTFDLSGSLDRMNENFIDLKFNTNTKNISFLSEYITKEALQLNRDFLQNGRVYVNGEVTGSLNSKNIEFKTDFGVHNLNLKLPDNLGKFTNFGFTGNFNSGSVPNFRNAILNINNLKGKTPSGEVSGNLHITNFVTPYVKYNLHASLPLNGFDKLFKLKEIENLKGEVDLKMKFDGKVDYENEHNMDEASTTELTFKNIGFVEKTFGNKIHNITGHVEEINNQIQIDDFKLEYNSSDITINGEINNLYHFLFMEEDSLALKLSVSSNELNTADLLFDSEKPRIKETLHDVKFDFSAHTKRKPSSIDDSSLGIDFDISKFSFNPEKLVEISNMKIKGSFYEEANNKHIDLSTLSVAFPEGNVNLSAKLQLQPDDKITLQTNLKTSDLPLNYLYDLIAELNPNKDPQSKMWPLDSLDIINLNLSLVSQMKFMPFAIDNIEIKAPIINFTTSKNLHLIAKNTLLNLGNITFDRALNAKQIIGVNSISGSIKIPQLLLPKTGELDVAMKLMMEDDFLNLNFEVTNDYIKKSSGNLQIGFVTPSKNSISFTYRSDNINLEKFLKPYQEKKLLKGNVNLSIDLNSTGADTKEMTKNLGGSVIISGDSLMFYGIALDKILKTFKRSQKFNLVDLSAFILAGPLGTAITKGSNFAKLLKIEMQENDSTKIAGFMVNWKIKEGTIRTKDVAISTEHNRIAFLGELDFINDTIPGFSVAILDPKGCAIMTQKFYGSIDSIQIKKIKIAKTLMGSVINVTNAVVGKKCVPVYQGSVQHPSKKKETKNQKGTD